MADEMIAPLIDNYDNKEEDEKNIDAKKEIIHKDNDNELTNLLEHREENRNNININNNRNNINYISININLNENQKRGLIYLSYSIQLIIYFFILNHFYDKDNFIKNNIIIFFVISLIFVIIIIILDVFNNNYLREIKYRYLFIISIISSLGFYFFLYEISVIFTFKIIKFAIILSIVMYLASSIIIFLYRENYDIRAETFYCSLGICLIVGIILDYFSRMVDDEMFMLIFFMISILYGISFLHLELSFDNRHPVIRIKDYPLIHMYLFMDVSAISLICLIMHSIVLLDKKMMQLKEKNLI